MAKQIIKGFRFKRREQVDQKFDFETWGDNLRFEKWDAINEQLDQIVAEDKQKKHSSKGRHNREDKPPKILQVDEEGCTPLHYALYHANIPEEVLLRIIKHQPEAAHKANKEKGQLPLHLAVEHDHGINVLKEIAPHNPFALQEKDAEGKTTIALGVGVASRKSKETEEAHCWGTKEESKTWQQNQKKAWSSVKWLLEESAKNQGTKLEVVDELLTALTFAAPPPIVSLLVEVSSERLSNDAAFAWSALSLCIVGHYPSDALKSIAVVSPDEVVSARDEAGIGLVGLQFTVGCFEVDEVNRWKVREDRFDVIEQWLENKTKKRWWDEELIDWWEKLKYLIIFCGKCPEEENNILCDALSNPDTPPLVIELLLVLEPGLTSHRWEKIMPIHVAASTRRYIRKYHEPDAVIGGVLVLDRIVKTGVDRSSYCRYRDRLPLHYAIECGKTWQEIKPMVSGKRSTVRRRDPVTKLYPFQLAATRTELNEGDMEWITLKVRNQYNSILWDQLLIEEQERHIQDAFGVESRRRLHTVYELLRRSPTTLNTAIRNTEPSKQFRDSSGMGMVGAHFALWCFKYANRVFIPNKEQIEMLKGVTRQGNLKLVSTEFEEWWHKAKFWIWQCFKGEVGTTLKEGILVVPRTDEYLLHAALSNSDTPPQLIHLLLNLFPESSSFPIPNTDVLPLHIVALEDSYLPRRHECEAFPTATAMDLVLNANTFLVRKRTNGRLPLHLALEAGKTWNEVEGLVVADERTIAIKDPVTGFFPFQLSAVRKSTKSEQRRQFQWAAFNRVSETQWKKASTLERNRAIRAEQAEYELNVLTAVYQLILIRPDLTSRNPCLDEPEFVVIKRRASSVIRCQPTQDHFSNEVDCIGEEETVVQGKDDLIAPTIQGRSTEEAQGVAASNGEVHVQERRLNEEEKYRAGYVSPEAEEVKAAIPNLDAREEERVEDIVPESGETTTVTPIHTNWLAEVPGIPRADISSRKTNVAPKSKEPPAEVGQEEAQVGQKEAQIEDFTPESGATHAVTPTTKETQASPTFGYYDSSKVEQTWLKGEHAEEKVYHLRSGWAARRQSRHQVTHFIEHETGKNLPCLTCNEGKREALLLPCRHLCVCRRCSVKVSLDVCPLCTSPVKSTTVIYL